MVTLTLHGLRKSVNEIDFSDIFKKEFWQEDSGKFTFGMFEEQISVFLDPISGIAVSAHQRKMHYELDLLQKRMETRGSAIRRMGHGVPN